MFLFTAETTIAFGFPADSHNPSYCASRWTLLTSSSLSLSRADEKKNLLALSASPGAINDQADTPNTMENGIAKNVKKGIIFDIDGTLADSWQLGFDATNKVLRNNDIETISEETYHQGTKFTTPNRLARHAGLEPADGSSFETMGEKLAKEFDELYIGLVSTETARFYPGIGDLLLRVPSDIALGVLTNAAVDYAHAVLKVNSIPLSPSPGSEDKMQLYHRFQSIRGADNVPQAKPEPDGLWTVCDDLGVAPSDCVYIGDSPSDGKAALAAGMSFVGVSWGSHSREALSGIVDPGNKNEINDPIKICDTVEELNEVLAGYLVER